MKEKKDDSDDDDEDTDDVKTQTRFLLLHS